MLATLGLLLCNAHVQVMLTYCSVTKCMAIPKWWSCDQAGDEVGERLLMNELCVPMGVEKGGKLTDAAWRTGAVLNEVLTNTFEVEETALSPGAGVRAVS